MCNVRWHSGGNAKKSEISSLKRSNHRSKSLKTLEANATMKKLKKLTSTIKLSRFPI